MRWLQSLGWPVATGLLLAFLYLETTQQAPHDAAPAVQATASYADAVSRASPAVVNIFTTKVVRSRPHPLFNDPLFRRLFNLPAQERLQRSLGSGVIMSDAGYLLTNLHVIDGADEIAVMLHDGRDAFARVVGTDPDTDLAVLKIDLEPLQPIELGNPTGTRVGDVVLAIGNPYGFQQTVTQGIVSATGRYGLGLNTYENYIQTDAAINPGNSGGALIDAQGRLLGINSAFFGGRSGDFQGIGLAIPSDYATKVLDDLINHGEVRRGWLGLEVQPMPARVVVGDEERVGLLVSGIVDGGPAAAAGLQVGDVIVAINGIGVDEGRSPMYRIAMTEPGTQLRIEVIRDSGLGSVPVTLGER